MISKIFDCDKNKNVSYSEFIDRISKKQVIYLGETHAKSPIINFQKQVLQALVQQTKQENSNLTLIMEHFAFNQQEYLDKFSKNQIDINQLIEDYKNSGNENHDILKYQDLLHFARDENINIQAGFVPRSFAKDLVANGQDDVFLKMKKLNYLDETKYLNGTSEHYNYFDSLISGRNLETHPEPSDKFRKIFPAQILKDQAMAYHIVKNLLKSKENDKFLVIMGKGHCEYGFGVPERVVDHISNVQDIILSVRDSNDYDMDDQENQDSEEMFEFIKGFGRQLPSNFIYFWSEEQNDIIKNEIQTAYEKVADKIATKGVTVGDKRQMLLQRGYTEEELNVVGSDNVFYQGVGCPHRLAKIQQGNRVVDMGCGFGIDSMIAASKCGLNGKVIAFDLSQGEIKRAQQNAQQKEIKNIEFMVGDIENFSLNEQVDVIISNGAFCLVPDKPKAFKNMFDLLKPGGRISIACSVQMMPLPEGVEWPLCMKVFYPYKDIEPLLQKIGYEDIYVDTSDSLMSDPKDISQQQDNEEKDDKIIKDRAFHFNDPTFNHLKKYDMNQLCARVVISAVKK